MFWNATSFSRDLSKWKVYNVTDMAYMFAGATSFNRNLSNWDVSWVENITGMFENATRFDVANHAPWYTE